ncbi:MAG: hypothetical protein IJ563_10735 [Selenomonadaceae bacterium]|nr:hypothetical protein [Selenomonadaceae bacterium]
MLNIKRVVLLFLMSFVILSANVQIGNATSIRTGDEGVLYLVSKIKTVLNSSTQDNLIVSNAVRESSDSNYVSKFYQNGFNYGQINFYMDGQGYVQSIKFLSYSMDNRYIEVCGYVLWGTAIALGMTQDEANAVGDAFQSGNTNFSIYCTSKKRYFDFNAYVLSDNLNIDLSAHT